MVAVEILHFRWLSKSCDCSTSGERSEHGTPGTSTTTCSECSELKEQLGNVTWRLEDQEAQMDMLCKLMEGLRSSMQILPPAPLPLPSSASPVVPSSNNPPPPQSGTESGVDTGSKHRIIPITASIIPPARCIHNLARNGHHPHWCLGNFVVCTRGRQHTSPAVHQCSWGWLLPSILPSTCNDGEWRNGGGCPDSPPHNSCKSCWSTHSWRCSLHGLQACLVTTTAPHPTLLQLSWPPMMEWLSMDKQFLPPPLLPFPLICPQVMMQTPVVSQYFYWWALPFLVPPFHGDHVRGWNAFGFQCHLFPSHHGESHRCF